jgi:hypothetical protein
MTLEEAMELDVDDELVKGRRARPW